MTTRQPPVRLQYILSFKAQPHTRQRSIAARKSLYTALTGLNFVRRGDYRPYQYGE